MSKIKAIALKFGGATLGRSVELKRIKDGDVFVVPIGAEVAVDLTTLGAANQDVGAETVIEEGLCYVPRFEVRSDGKEGLGEIFGTGGTDQNPNPGARTEPGYPPGFGFGESRWKATRGYGFIINQLAGNEQEETIILHAFLKLPDGTEIKSNGLGISWRNIKVTKRDAKGDGE